MEARGCPRRWPGDRNSIWLNYLTLPPNRHVIWDNALLLSAPIWMNSSPRNEIQSERTRGKGRGALRPDWLVLKKTVGAGKRVFKMDNEAQQQTAWICWLAAWKKSDHCVFQEPSKVIRLPPPRQPPPPLTWILTDPKWAIIQTSLQRFYNLLFYIYLYIYIYIYRHIYNIIIHIIANWCKRIIHYLLMCLLITINIQAGTQFSGIRVDLFYHGTEMSRGHSSWGGLSWLALMRHGTQTRQTVRMLRDALVSSCHRPSLTLFAWA